MADPDNVIQGHCRCGNIRYRANGAHNWSGNCHCDDCRRNCAAPLVAWLGVPIRNFKWLGAAPKTIESSKGVRRHFCEACGSPMGFEADHYPGGMHIYAASLQEPGDFRPTFHVNYGSKLPWLQIADDLPKYAGTLLDTISSMLNAISTRFIQTPP